MGIKETLIVGLIAGLVLIVSEFVSSILLAVDYSSSISLWKEVTNVWWYGILLIDLFEGMIFAMGYTAFYKGIPGTKLKKGLGFGLFVWFLGVLPIMATIYVTMTIPNIIIFSWAVGALVNFLLAGCVVSLAYERIKFQKFL